VKVSLPFGRDYNSKVAESQAGIYLRRSASLSPLAPMEKIEIITIPTITPQKNISPANA
jgi:hypothetical protein